MLHSAALLRVTVVFFEAMRRVTTYDEHLLRKLLCLKSRIARVPTPIATNSVADEECCAGLALFPSGKSAGSAAAEWRLAGRILHGQRGPATSVRTSNTFECARRRRLKVWNRGAGFASRFYPVGSGCGTGDACGFGKQPSGAAIGGTAACGGGAVKPTSSG